MSFALKVIILAAGSGKTPDLKELQPLGEQIIIDYVADSARQMAPPQDTIVVVGSHAEQVQNHLGANYHYVEQSAPLGTGHAILQALPMLQDYHGDILILYGDTPLIRYSSLQGMLTRHRLRAADLTLLSAVVSEPLPYGRIVRDAEGMIVDVIEESQLSGHFREIQELNVGAYVVQSDLLFGTLQALDQNQSMRLTDIVHKFIRAGKYVESYRIYDPDEILGINNEADRQQAELILQKRYLRPMRVQEESRIEFGTGGWRAIIGEGFTFANVRRLTQALANRVVRERLEKDGIVIGYDRRFMSDRAAIAAAEVFAGNNIPVFLMNEACSTPQITYATEQERAALGLAFTASHNPPEWNGVKVFKHDGSLLQTAETRAIEDEANQLRVQEVVKISQELATQAHIIQRINTTNAYIDAIESFVDMDAIRAADLRLIVDPMFGVGHLTLGTILAEARCRVTMIHTQHDPLFGGRSPAPDSAALSNLIRLTKEGDYDLGLAMDGDADRIALVDEHGEFISTNDLLLLLYYYLYTVKGHKGGVVRNLATTHLLDRLARHFGETSHEVPVGFKHVSATLDQYDCLLGGESSGGLTIRGHIKGKDGILGALLIVEMLAVTQQQISSMREQIYNLIGRLYTLEENIPATSEMKVMIPKKLREQTIKDVARYPVLSVSDKDGTKFLLENDNWLLIRFSGTEPLLRIFAEADTAPKAQDLINWAKRLAG